MHTVAIICEYNPFHNGHKYQIDKIREEFGQDTCIVAIMSGNFTQRGEIAIADKSLRARCAVDSGVNLCLELPFPFSISSAEFFASSAVHIANSIGTVEYLSFGSESGDIDVLTRTAECMMSEKYALTFKSLAAEGKNEGYPKICERALLLAFGKEESFAKMSPNNILAVEYIKALMRSSSTIKPHTIKRRGSEYDDTYLCSSKYPSAAAIRASVLAGDISALEYVPDTTKHLIISAIESGEFPCLEDRLSTAVISALRLNSPLEREGIHDTKGGLYNRLITKSFEAHDINTLVLLTETKKYTTARIRRIMWYSFFGVTSSEVYQLPMYTQLLAMDSLGRSELKRIKKISDFPILTKPSRTDKLNEGAMKQKSAADRADSLFQLTKPSAVNGNYALTFTPYVKYGE